MQFEVLGPLRVTCDGTEAAMAGMKRRALLTRLLVDANRAVPADRLVEDLWEGAPPVSATSTLQSHISHLRRMVGGRLRTVPGGYAIDVADDELDSLLFDGEIADARRTAATDPRAATELLDRALGRWRGAALADVAGASWAIGEAARLEELRLVAIECDLDARLVLGDHAEVVARAEAAVTQHPLRERLWGFLVTALYRDGRQADALRTYERLRKLLADEVGIAPSPELQALERAVLAQDASLSVAAGPANRPPAVAAAPATGVVTFLMTDIVGSTRLWEAEPDAMKQALARHDDIVREGIDRHRGRVFATGGDGVAAAFTSPADAAAAAVDAQHRLLREPWPEAVSISVRMGIHTGRAQERDDDYFGPALNRCARLMASAHGGQILCTGTTAEFLQDEPEMRLHDLGSHRLRDLATPVAVFQVGDGSFPPLSSVDALATNLPIALTDLIGRVDDVVTLSGEVRAHRLVTLTGVGGVGKTRLSLAIGATLAEALFDGAWLVELAPVGDGDDVVNAVAAALGAPPVPGLEALPSLLAHLAERRLLLILDNCEHVLDAAAELAEVIVSSTADVHVLATSREPLGVGGEVVRGVRSLGVPDEDATPAEAGQAAAVRLFVDRARAADADFVVDGTNARAVTAICRRLDGVPLAIELAAARVRTMTPPDIARRLDDRFRVLTGARRSQERHRTLFATVAWSHDMLTTEERSAFAQLSVFPSTFDLSAASAVVSVDGLGPDDVADCVLRLVDRSLVVHERTSGRYRLLETLRQFGADRLAEVGQADAVLSRYVEHYVTLVTDVAPGLADRRHDDAIGILAAELDNIRACTDVLIRSERWDDLGSLALAGWRFFTQFTPSEASAWFALTLERGGLAEPGQQAEAAAVMAVMAGNLALQDEAVRHAERSLTLARAHGFDESPWAHLALAMAASYRMDWDTMLLNAQATAAAGEARGDELARVIGLAESILPLIKHGRLDDADGAADEAVDAAARLRNGTALSVALIGTCVAYSFGADEPNLDRARTLVDRHGDAAVQASAGLNRAWLLIHRAVVEAHRDPRRAAGYAAEAARIADRTSPFALVAAVQALALACALDGDSATARALLAHPGANATAGLDLSETQWLMRELARVLEGGDDRQAPPAQPSRRQLMALIGQIENRVCGDR